MTVDTQSSSNATGRSNSRRGSTLEKLKSEPWQFDFFQAVRVLQWEAHHREQGPREVASRVSPKRELVRYYSIPSHAFPQGAISEVGAKSDGSVESMRVSFMGLFGPSGVLPRHYTQLVIDRTRAKDTTLRDFLDVFNQRAIGHFFKAWAKYQLPAAFEDAYLNGRPREDMFTRSLLSLVGLGSKGVCDRQENSDDAMVYYGGLFSHFPRNASSLQSSVSEMFQIAAEVKQFVGQWLHLHPNDQSRLTNDRRIEPNNCLGQNVVVGDRVWGIENNFRLRLGPMGYTQFLDLSPAGEGLTKLAQFVRSYVGISTTFDVQLVLEADEVPMSQLAAQGQPATSRLGWNTWLRNEPFDHDADDAVFVHAGVPTRP